LSTVADLHFLIGGQAVVVGQMFVFLAGHEVEDVLLEVGRGAGDRVDMAIADHACEDDAQLGRAHGAGQADQHLVARTDERLEGFCRVQGLAGVVMTIMLLEKR
jgi:hypothetical protein